MSASLLRLTLLAAACFSFCLALPSSYPNTDGQPDGDYSPEWQSYYRVTDELPGISFPLPSSYAGSIGVQREGHPNNTLFFWGFEKYRGSLSRRRNREPWGIWLNGGPGSSSMVGLFLENGPFRANRDNSLSRNPYSWDKVADYFWVDSPVGVGFSTADEDGYVPDEDQLGRDFWGFVSNLVKVFPGLARRPLVISGESYAGVYIPYILKTYFELPERPVPIHKIAIGDGTLNTDQISILTSILSVIQTFPQIIGYDPEVYSYFRTQHELCHYNISLQYPQPEQLPYIPLVLSSVRDIPWASKQEVAQFSLREIRRRFEALNDQAKRERVEARSAEGGIHKRDLSLRANGTLDPWYGCDLIDEMIEYAVNYTYPWNEAMNFNIYDVPDGLGFPHSVQGLQFDRWMNDPAWRAALHAPTSKNWTQSFPWTFGELSYRDPSPKPMVFLSDLTSQAVQENIGVVLYAANNDALIAHRGLEVTIQNTTWAGTRGFTRKPATPWRDYSGEFAGIIHQERGLTYALFDDASHLVPMTKPLAALTFAREFIFGNNRLGSVWGSRVIGGEDPDLMHDILRGGDEIYVGAGATESTYIWPSETRAAWDAFIATASAV